MNRLPLFPQHSRNRSKFFALLVMLNAFFVCASAQAQPPEEQPRVIDVTDGSDPFNRQQPAPVAAAEQPKKDAIPRNPQEVVEALGYFFVAPFLLASFIAVWFAIERIIVLRKGRVIPRPFVERFLQHLQQGRLEPQAALQLCEQSGSPVAAVFAHGIRKWGKPSVEVEQAIIDGGERQVSQLRKHLRVLNGVATVTPLIGLLGTVLGMIQAFNQIAATSADQTATELAIGIAVALLTTAAGLVIAIPSLILYMYLAGRVDALVIEMDHLAQNVVHLISAEGLAASRMASAAPPAEPEPSAKSSKKTSKAKEKV